MVGGPCVPSIPEQSPSSSSLDGPGKAGWKDGAVHLRDKSESLLLTVESDAGSDTILSSACPFFTYNSKDRLASPVAVGEPFTSTDLSISTVSSVALMSAGWITYPPCPSVVARTKLRDFVSQGHRE